jgi:hypothetical protein
MRKGKKIEVLVPDDFPENMPEWIVERVLRAFEARHLAQSTRIAWFQAEFKRCMVRLVRSGQAIYLGRTSGGFEQYKVSPGTGFSVTQVLDEIDAVILSEAAHLV